MGLVYRAYHPQLERFGAVKVMHAISPDRDSIARFRHEAQAIARMRHPNIVNVYDFGEYEGTPYMIVEYVPGGNLASKMDQKPLDQATRAWGTCAGSRPVSTTRTRLASSTGTSKPANVLLETDATPVTGRLRAGEVAPGLFDAVR